MKLLSMKSLKNHNKKENMTTKEEEKEEIEAIEEIENKEIENKEMINNKDSSLVANITNHLKLPHNFNSKEKKPVSKLLSERTKLWKLE